MHLNLPGEKWVWVSCMIYKIRMFSVHIWRFRYCWFGGHWVGECSRLLRLHSWRLARTKKLCLDRGKNRSRFDDADLRTTKPSTRASLWHNVDSVVILDHFLWGWAHTTPSSKTLTDYIALPSPIYNHLTSTALPSHPALFNVHFSILHDKAMLSAGHENSKRRLTEFKRIYTTQYSN